MLLPEEDYHILDLAVSTTKKHKESISMILSEKCNISLDRGSELNKDLLLTENVCSGALLWLIDERESLYGSSSMKDDTEALKKCSEKDRKLYHSLTLRVSERRILKKLRAYAAARCKIVENYKRASKSKRRKRT